MRLALTLLAASLLPLAAAAPASAQEAAPDMEAFRGHLDAALAHYEARRYAEAASAFRAAYAIRAEPELVYNIARSYERALMREEAIAAYDEFVGLPGTTSEMRARALAARNSLRAEVDALQQGEPPPEPEPGPEPDVEEELVVAPLGPEPEPAPASPVRTAGWVVLGVGAASLIAGGVFGGLALKANGDFGETTVRSEQEALQDDVRRNALAADILVGAGALLALCGVLLVVVGKPDAPEEDTRATFRLEPMVGTTTLGVSLGGQL